MTDKPNDLRTLRFLAFCEGASLLLLVGIAMPMKHVWNVPIAVRVAGTVHGVAFLLYLAAVIDAYTTHRMKGRHALVAMLAALIPAGTFVVARRLRADASDGGA
ncbi:Hypothetical protein A7982_11032 [Minicystis rosea]|nr:Hypothetical protein A7982_11032 [Minicystis rosea]